MSTVSGGQSEELYQLQLNRPVYYIARSMIKVLAWIYFRARSSGKHNYPEPPYLVAFNHSSNLDIVALSLAEPGTIVSAMAKESLFKTPVIGWFVRRLGFVPVRRGEQDNRAFATALDYLQQGGIFVMAPEGTRRRSLEEPPRPRTGIVRLAQLTGVPILPVGVSGTYAALPPGASVPRPRHLSVRVGKPIQLPPVAVTQENYPQLQEQAKLVVERIYELVKD